jgi:dephospho-CoA kinase
MDRRHRRSTPLILGLTGPIGCGKTTVGDILLDLGALDRIDGDQVVHGLMGPDSEVAARVAEAFGPAAIAPDGSVDRQALGRIVFGDPGKLRQLESITHPAVRREIRRRIDALDGAGGVVVVDAVKLLQSDLLPLTDAVWVVTCDRDEEMRRLTEQRRMTPEDAAARVRAQPSFDHPRVSRVIENNQSLMKLRDNVTEGWVELTRPGNE